MTTWQTKALEWAQQIEHNDVRVRAIMLAVAGDESGLLALRYEAWRDSKVSAADHRLVVHVLHIVTDHS